MAPGPGDTSDIDQVRFTDKPGTWYGNVHIHDRARVHLGDSYGANSDLFETGTREQKIAALRNALLYNNAGSRRAQLYHTLITPKSFSWVKDTVVCQWLKSNDDLFWIQGKPGSGKSMLMRWLSDCKWTRDVLNSTGAKWTVVHFFYDFRAGTGVANNPVGMLKTILYQMATQIQAVENGLLRDSNLKSLENAMVEELIDMLVSTLLQAESRVCAFVDGLDEYDGDLVHVMSALEQIRDRTNMKLCLASRPEPVLQRWLGRSPNIAMQDHNSASILEYIQQNISASLSTNPDIEHLFTTSLQQTICKRANGVILWSRLAVDELIKASTQATSTDDLLHVLDILPAELGSFYERILQRIAPAFRVEAAIILKLVSDYGGSIGMNLLVEAGAFVLGKVIPSRKFPDLNKTDSLATRIKVLLGNVLEVIPSNIESSGFEESFRLNLIHQSFQTYLQNSPFLVEALHDNLSCLYAGHVWFRLSLQVLDEFTEAGILIGSNTSDITISTRLPWGLNLGRFRKDLIRSDWTGLWKLFANCASIFARSAHEAEQTYDSTHAQTSRVFAGPIMSLVLFYGSYLAELNLRYLSDAFPYVRCCKQYSHLALALNFGFRSHYSNFMSTEPCKPNASKQNLFTFAMWTYLRKRGELSNVDGWIHEAKQRSAAQSITLMSAVSNSSRRANDANPVNAVQQPLDELSWLRQQIEILTDHGCYLDSQHICCALYYKSPDIDLLQRLMRVRQKRAWLTRHESHCVCRVVESPLLYEWCKCHNFTLSESAVRRFSRERHVLLQLIIETGEDLNLPCFQGNFAIHWVIGHDIKAYPSNEPGVLSKLLILIRLGADPFKRGDKGTALQHAQDMRQKTESLLTESIRAGLRKRMLLYRDELDTAIELLRYWEENKQWPDLAVYEKAAEDFLKRALNIRAIF